MRRLALLVLLTAGAASAARGVFAHFAIGDGWATSTVFTNSADTPQLVQASFYFDGYSGEPAPSVTFITPAHGTFVLDAQCRNSLCFVPLAGEPAPSVTFTIAAHETFVLHSNPTNQLETGWIVATADSLQSIDGTTIYRYSRAGYLDEEVAVPMAKAPSKDIVLPFDNTQGFSNGVAIANASTGSTVHALLIARDQFGSTITTASVQMAPLAHTAFILADQYPALKNQQGTIEYQVAVDPTTGAFGEPSILGIRANPSGSFMAILPVLVDVFPCTAPPP